MAIEEAIKIINPKNNEEVCKMQKKFCGICFTESFCRIIKIKRFRKWHKIYACTKCLPVNMSINFGDDFVVMQKSELNMLYRCIKHLSNTIIKQGLLIYVYKGSSKKAKKENLKVGFEETEESEEKTG